MMFEFILAVNFAVGALRLVHQRHQRLVPDLSWSFAFSQWLSALPFRCHPDYKQWDDFAFSGVALEDGKWWTLVTATFDHDGMSHLMNNMLMLASFGKELEELVGPLAFVVLWVSTGAAGWLTTYGSLRVRHRGDAWFAAQYQAGVGSSPATYGMLAFLSVADPHRIIARFLGLSQWMWVAMLLTLPQMCRTKYGVQWWEENKGRCRPGDAVTKSSAGGLGINWRSLVYAIASFFLGWLILPALLRYWMFSGNEEEPHMLTAAGYWTVYLGHLGLLKVAERLLLKKPPTIVGCDNASHIGGFVLGLFGAVVYGCSSNSGFAGIGVVVAQVALAGIILLARWLRDFVNES